MTTLNASAAGTFRIGGDIEVNRLGFGAMRITGKGVWGEPADRAEALRTLQRLPELGDETLGLEVSPVGILIKLSKLDAVVHPVA